MKKILLLLFLTLMFLSIKHQIKAQACTDFAVIVGNWGDASLQRFDGTTGNYSNQLATGIGARINSVLQYPSPNGNLYLGGYEEVNVVNAFTGAVSFSFTGGSLSGLTEQIVVGLDGKVYVANEGTGAGLGSIARYNATTGAFIDNFISFPSYQPNGLAQDAAGNWYVSTRNTPNQVLKYNSSGVLQGIVTTMGTTQQGGGLKVYNNELYVVTTDSPQTVKVYSLPVTSFPATPVRTLNTGGSTYVGIAFGPDNNMYMADFYNSRVSVWNPQTGTLVRNLTNSSIANPHGVGFTTCTPCTPPTVGTVAATQATCTGTTANSNAKIDVTGISGGDKYSYGTDTTAFTYASATAFSGSSISISSLANPSTATTYYVRVYNGSGLCFKTVSAVLQPKNCSTPVVLTPICATNQIGNYSLEDGVSNVTTTIGGSDATFAVTGGDGPTDIHVEAGGTYWVDAGSHGGKGSVNGNYLIWYPTAAVGNTNKCTSWAGGSYNFTVGSCYSICYKVAAFNPANLSEGSVALIEFGDPAVGWTKSFTTGGVLETGDPSIYAVSWNLPAPSAPKDITGASYTGASGQVIDWKTLDWQTVCINMTPPSTQSGIGVNFSTKGDAATGVTKGMALDDISVCTGCSVVCTKPTVGTATSTQATCTGSTVNSDAKLTVSGISGGDKYSYGTDSTTFTYASATAFTGASISITGLANPSTATTYYVRVYNGTDACYKTVSVVLQPKTCITCPSTTYPLCTGESYTLSTPAGMTNVQWYKNGVAIAAPAGTATSLVVTTIGDYVYTGLPSGGTCKDSLCCPVKIVAGTNCCTKPTIGTPVATQATCTGSTVNSDAKLTVSGISGGDKYSYGTDSTTFTYASATAFTGASINITGLANPSTATTYYVRVYNGTDACYKTVSVVLQPKTCVVACTISATSSQVSCNNNATLASASDDYITALLTPTGTAGERFTLTATRGGNPIAVTLSDGTTIGQLSYAYPTPIRFANGSAGAGNIVLTLTDVANTSCSTTVTLTDPGACVVTTCTPTPQTVSYAYRTTFQTTDLNAVPLLIPKFDVGGGTRTLTKVELKFGMTQATNSLTENTAATNASFKLALNTSSLIELGSTVLLDKSNTYSTGSTFITLPAGIIVPASGTYGGDQTYLGGTNLSTLEGMKTWLDPYMTDILGVSPLTDPRWVTNATGVATNDDDIFYIPTQTFADKDSVTYTTAGDLTQFVGTGNLPLTATTLNGISTTGGGGNLITRQNTKAYAYATVIYTYTCCTKPTVGTAVSTQATCTGSTANSDAKIDVSGISGGDKYVYGTDSTTFTYASATNFTGASISITGLANPSTATTYYVRVYNGLETCYKTVSVVLQPKTCVVTCTNPTVGALTATPATCNGAVANADAKLNVTGISGGDKYSYGTSTSSFAYASAVSLSGSSLTIGGLANPASATTYYVRIYNGTNTCFTDMQVTLLPTNCNTPCGSPNCLSIGVRKN